MRAQTDQPVPRFDDRLTRQARSASPPEKPEKLLFRELGCFETLATREHLDMTGPAARRTARKRHGSEMLVADVDEGAALGGFHALRRAEAVA